MTIGNSAAHGTAAESAPGRRTTTGPRAGHMLIFLLAMAAAAQMGLQGWFTLLNNFSVEKAGFTGFETGVVQSVREIPGLLALLVAFLLLIFREHRLLAGCVAIMGLGVGLTGLFPSLAGIVTTTLLMSFGYHYYETVNQSLTLQYFDRLAAPRMLGRLRAVTASANIAAGAAVWIGAHWLDYPAMYGGLGLLVFLAGLWGLTRDPSDPGIPPQRKKMVLRRRYWLFYALTLLAGARRTIMVAFAVFLMVKKFGFSVTEVTTLFIINNLINVVVNPLIGRAINRFGERTLLGIEYMTTTAIFITYALADQGLVVAGAYVIDQITFNFAMAINTYFQKVADPRDIASSTAVGFTINHVAAVFIPFLGGMLWLIDYRLVFFFGAGLTIVSLILTRFIRTKIGRQMESRV